jgi:hypothetical protein
MTANGAEPVLRRRKHGSGHSYTLDGAPVPGVTTILGMVPKPALTEWAGRVTANYALDHWADLAKLPPSERLKRLNSARHAERDAAARKGTAVHRIAERLASGEAVTYPDELAGHVDTYTDFLARTSPHVVAVELVVASRAHKYCGTADAVMDLPALTVDYERIPAGRWLLEIKTSASGVYRESALQACGYCRAEIYLDNDDEVGALDSLKIERCGVLHVRADGWDLRPLDTGEDTWAYFCHLAWLYHHDEASASWIGAAAEPPPLADLTSAPF